MDSADTQDGWPDMEKELSCSICTDIFYQPLTLLDCLHTFCGSCLKEWFTWQAAAAARSGRTVTQVPYTCPQCRETVRDTKADWRLTTLLEGYLKAHPGRGKTDVEKEEMRLLYKPGDNVIPPVSQPARSRDRDDERLVAEVRELSLLDVGGARSSRRREQQGTSTAHNRAVATGRSQREPSASADTTHSPSARQTRQVEHQSSLRSLLSASPVQVGDVQQEILQSIYSEGLLDGVDIDALTPEQEEELTERIAEAYRRRQRRRDRSRHQESNEHSNSSPQSPPSPRRTSPDRSTRHSARSSESRAQDTRTRPPIARPHLFEQPSTTHGSRRRSTSNGDRHRSGQRTRGEPRSSVAPAARSATDLSQRPRTAEAERERRGRISSEGRSRTEPQLENNLTVRHRARASSGNAAVVSSTAINQGTSHTQAPVDATSSQQDAHEPQPTNTSDQLSLPTSSSEQAIRSPPSLAAFAPEPVSNLERLPSVPIPSLKCSRCQKMEIQGQLHYHCPHCRNGHYNLCLACYRDGQGCDHWFGFGYTALERWRRLEPPEDWPANYGKPHVLQPQRYAAPSTNTPFSLEQGAFCEMCFTFCDDFYWSCAYCMDGAWGYCRTCVQQGRHCTHPLLQVTHLTSSSSASPREQLPPAGTNPQYATISLPHLIDGGDYVAVPDATDCDLCHRPIPATNTRYHCYRCSDGNYDICTECYGSLVTSGKVRVSNGPNGWRRCLHGHRMVIVGYQDVPGRGQQRVTVRDPVGGWRHQDSASSGNTNTSKSGGLLSPSLPPPADGTLGMRCLAAWNRFPGAEIEDELSFPKNAEIREVEHKNADWCLGVYAGSVGLFPRNHVRML